MALAANWGIEKIVTNDTAADPINQAFVVTMRDKTTGGVANVNGLLLKSSFRDPALLKTYLCGLLNATYTPNDMACP